MNNVRGRRVVLTGGAGFLGQSVYQRLLALDPLELHVPRSATYDLRERRSIDRLFTKTRPEVVIHLAATVGGIGANKSNPGRFFYDNAIMGIELLEQCRRFDVAKVVVVGTTCSYPKHADVPFSEDKLWDGFPEETNAPYGMAKKILLVQAQAYREQYGMNSIYLLPVNLYGPRDNFDPMSSHVVAALIRKVVEALEHNASEITVWGSGNATREFLFVDDAAKAIALATNQYDSAEPVNLGSGCETKISDLVELICEVVGFHGNIRWDTSKPDGQSRRCIDTTRAFTSFGFQAQTSLRDGLRETVEWYRSNVSRTLSWSS